MAGPIRVRLAAGHADLGVDPVVVDGPERDAGKGGDGANQALVRRLDGVRGRVEIDGEARRVLLLPGPRVARPAPGVVTREVVVDGWRFIVETEPEGRAALRERARRGRAEAAGGGPTEIRAVIPGRVLSVAVGEGDTVRAGQPMLVVEAMKMQNELRAPRDGTVLRVAAAEGRTIELGDLLLVLE